MRFPGTTYRKVDLLKRRLCLTALVLIGALAIVETVLRVLGVLNAPLYDVNSRIGYEVSANQRGKFLNTNHWLFNNKHMGAEEWSPRGHRNVLLLGNSIVMGGNPYDQPNKLGPLLERFIGNSARVWPMGTAGWTTVNEMIYLDNNKDVLAASDIVVWEVMPGGLSQLATWHGEYVFPTHQPSLATYYVLRRYVMRRLLGAGSNSELPPTGTPKPEFVAKFSEKLHEIEGAGQRSAILIIYPNMRELMDFRGGGASSGRDLLLKMCKAYGIPTIDLFSDPHWQPNLYREDREHPTIDGNKVLAGLIAQRLKSIFTSVKTQIP